MGPFGRLCSALDQAGFCGDVAGDVASRTVYGTDNSIYQTRPAGVVLPASAADLVALAIANNGLAQPFDLVARGGGTGTNGQSLTNGVVVDMRRRFNRIVSIDVDNREAVVEPGVVLGELNSRLATDGLFFAPHVSTASRATIGGMVSTDAAGKGSLVHGRTNDHVLSLRVVLSDGTPWEFARTSPDMARTHAERTDRVGDIYRAALEATAELDRAGFPDVPRGFTGYNLLAAAGADGGLDITKLLCGSEGTLALISEIRVRLTPLPRDPHVALVSYPSFELAVRDSNRLKDAGPSAIECLDERTIALATGSPAWPKLAALIQPEGEALLIMEFDGVAGVDRLRTLLPPGSAHASRATDVAVTADPATIADVWKVRADAVGLLGQAVGGRRSVAFVEDCAVPPRHLEAFVAGFRDLLDRHGLTYGMFGHADVGCVHVRPALDLYEPEHETMIRTVSDEVAALVASFGGVLWGEHGRGFRGEYLDLSDDLVHRMRCIKTAFDPRNVLNPGKLYAPLADDTPIVRIDEVPLRIHRDRTVAAAMRDSFDTAFGCNGNGICHHWGNAEVMCPSFKATLDPRLSPKGRADLVRGWLADPNDEQLADEVADSMRQCLSCGACTGRCPLGVDVPELKSRFLERHPESDRRRRMRDHLLARFEAFLPVAQRAARGLGAVQQLVAPLLASALRVVDLPQLPPGALPARLDRLGVAAIAADASPGDASVIVVPDAFSAFLEPSVLEATLALLAHIGERAVVGPFVPSGKYDHVKGRRKGFAKAVARQRSMLEALGGHGLPLVVVEPAVALLHRHEYPSTDPDYPSEAVTSLADFMETRLDRIAPGVRPADGGKPDSVQLFNHCTEFSLAPAHTETYRRLLERCGFTVEVEATTCCGMAGIFGHEVESQPMSRQLFDDYWRPRLEAGSPIYRCAPGYSCRSQAKRFDAPALLHPVVVAAESLRLL